MSKLTVTTIDTGNTTTNLSLTSGNTLGGKVVINAGGGVDVYGNSSVLMYVANSGGTHFVQNAYGYMVPTTLISGNATFSGSWVNVTSNTFNLGTATIGTATLSDGYTTLPNGLKLQWGLGHANSSGNVITYSTPFSVNAFHIFVSRPGSSDPGLLRVNNINATAFTLFVANTGVYQASYLAIGK